MKIDLHQAIAVVVTVILGITLGSAQTVKEVVSFTGNNSLGNPGGILSQARNGELYGTCPNPKDTFGSIFGLAPDGNLASLYTFGSQGGFDPRASLTLATDGNLYGTAVGGGTGDNGVLFRVSSKGVYTVLHNFMADSDGAGPEAAPIEGSDGNLYGTTSGEAGIFASTVYKYTPAGSFTTLYEFGNVQAESISTALIEGSDGNLYGTSPKGGAFGYGSIFKVSKDGTLLYNYSFPGFQSGAFPYGPLVQASNGFYYGTTYLGGSAAGYGTIFKMDSKGTVSIVYSFAAQSDGANPYGGLIQATDGNLYGTTSAAGTYGYGTIFRISTTGRFKALYSFSSAIGETPSAAPMQHTSGMFYGSLPFGSKFGYGAIYSLDMGLGPFVAFVLPTGKTGQTAQILGQGFTGTTSVVFHGVPAKSFKVESDTYMTAVIPSGATTGSVVVTTPSGKLTSNQAFRITK